MKKESLYKILIGLLLVLNIVQLSFFIIGGPPNHRPRRGGEERSVNRHIETLNLTDSQVNDFEHLIRDHHEQMTNLNQEQKELTSLYFNNPTSHLITKINNVESQKLELTTNHFDDIKKTLNQEQLNNFEEFKANVLGHILR